MVEGRRTENFTVEIKSGKHLLVADVGEKSGGHDRGLDPHGLLESSLTACTIITLQMYANRKQWKLDSADVKVSVVSESREESQITRQIHLRGELSDEQKQSLLEIANKCPIHKLLSSRITISTELV